MKQLSILLLLCLYQTINCQTVIWDGGGDGIHWADPENWDMNVLPDVGDSVVIAIDSVALTDIEPTIKNLLLLNGAILRNFTTITLKGSLSYGIRSENSKVVNNGTININEVGDYEFGDRSLELLNNSHFHNDISSILDIQESKCYGIRLESGSTFENDGVISVQALDIDRSGIYVGSSFENRNQLTIDAQGATGLTASSAGLFTNFWEINIDVSGLNKPALYVLKGASIINEHNIFINAENESRGLLITGFNSLLHQKSGIIQIDLNSANGIRLSGGELKIDSGATIEVNNPCEDYYIDIKPGTILDCQGILELGN